MVVLGNSSGCQVAVDLAVRYPNCICGLILVDPTVDPAARTASRQILRWLRDTLKRTCCSCRSCCVMSAMRGCAESPAPWPMRYATLSKANCPW